MDQLSLFDSPSSANDGEIVAVKNGEYVYYPDFFDKAKADCFLDSFVNNIDWKQESMNMYGKQVLFPRLTAWYGDNDKPYSFSGITLNPHPWNQDLLEIRKAIEPVCGVQFNSVLLNLYRNGNDSISWHTDAEKELGRNPVIASVNFGAERKFQIKHNETQETRDIILKHGSLLIMRGELQHYWKHQVPKQKAITQPRVNLTFRVIR